VVGVTPWGSGVYCITFAAGIDSTQTGAVVTPDYAHDNTDLSGLTNKPQAIAEFDSEPDDCDVGQLEVLTGVRSVTTTGSTDNDVA
jgi:hypothetical protein